MISVLFAETGSAAVSVAWIGLIGLIITSVVGPLILTQIRRLNDRNDRQHAEAAVAREAYGAERRSEFQVLSDRLARVEQQCQENNQAALVASQTLVKHTEEEIQRYGAITLLLVQLVGQRSVAAAENAAGLDPQEDI